MTKRFGLKIIIIVTLELLAWITIVTTLIMWIDIKGRYLLIIDRLVLEYRITMNKAFQLKELKIQILVLAYRTPKQT
jgi:hypothetical protein